MGGLDGHPHRISRVHAQGGHIGLRPRGDPVSIDRIDRENPGSLLTSGNHRIETFGSITGFDNKKKKGEPWMTRAADFRTEGGVIEGPRVREIDSDLGKPIEKERARERDETLGGKSEGKGTENRN